MRALLREIAAAYGELILDRGLGGVAGSEHSAWAELAADSVDRAAGIRLLLDVRETGESEPYPDAAAMVDDIAHGRFLVSTAHCDHPLWTPAENVAFRIVHDIIGHYGASVAAGYPADYVRDGLRPGYGPTALPSAPVAGFDWDGEVAACGAHGPILPTAAARRALFTECLAQTAYAIDRGGFGPQRVGFMDSYLCRGGPPDAAYCQFVNDGKVS